MTVPTVVKSVLLIVCGSSFLMSLVAFCVNPSVPWQVAIAGAAISLGALRAVAAGRRTVVQALLDAIVALRSRHGTPDS